MRFSTFFPGTTLKTFYFFSYRSVHLPSSTSRVIFDGVPHIKIFFNAQEAKPLPPLGPVIAMFQLNMASVCKDLNTASLDFSPGVEVRALIFKGKNKTYKIVLRPPTLKFLLEQALLLQFSPDDLKAFQEDETTSPSSVSHNLPVEVFYDVCRLHWFFSLSKKPFSEILLPSTPPYSVTRQIFSSLSSMHGLIKKIVVF